MKNQSAEDGDDQIKEKKAGDGEGQSDEDSDDVPQKPVRTMFTDEEKQRNLSLIHI